MPPTRRNFITSVTAMASVTVLPEWAGAAQSPQGWDLSFVDRFTGKHKQVFDVVDGSISLVVIKNWLDAWESVYGLKHPDVNAIAGIAGRGFHINASNELYEKFPIGRVLQVNDASGQPATRNVWLEERPGVFAGANVKALQARGVVFWMCNNALNITAARLAAAVQRPQPEVYQELRAGLNPGVIVVPAHTMLVGIVQEKGFTYEAV
jgi:hypothetical protein